MITLSHSPNMYFNQINLTENVDGMHLKYDCEIIQKIPFDIDRFLKLSPYFIITKNLKYFWIIQIKLYPSKTEEWRTTQFSNSLTNGFTDVLYVIRFQFDDILGILFECENEVKDYHGEFHIMKVHKGNTISDSNGKLMTHSVKKFEVFFKISKGLGKDSMENNETFEIFKRECHLRETNILFIMVVLFFSSGILFVIIMAVYDCYIEKCIIIKCFKNRSNRVRSVETFSVAHPRRTRIDFD